MRKLLEALDTIQSSSSLNLCSEKDTGGLYGDPSSHAAVSVRGHRGHRVLAKIALRKLLMGNVGLRDRGRLWTTPHRYTC